MIARELVTLLKPRISVLSVATAAAGLYLAPGTPAWALAACTLVGTLLLVGSAVVAVIRLVRDDVECIPVVSYRSVSNVRATSVLFARFCVPLLWTRQAGFFARKLRASTSSSQSASSMNSPPERFWMFVAG